MTTSSERTHFLSTSYPLEVLKERADIIENLVSVVLRGAADPYLLTSHPKAGAFTQSTQAVMFQVFVRQCTLPKRFIPDVGNTAKLLISALEDAQGFSMETLSTSVGLSNVELEKAVSKHFAVSPAGWCTAELSVEGAFQTALDNLARTKTRLVVFSAIHNLLKGPHVFNLNLDGADEIRKALYDTRARFLLNAATFGALLGGEAARKVARMLAEDSCHKNKDSNLQYAVMHFLEPEGTSPGGYYSKDEETFRKSIKGAYDKL